MVLIRTIVFILLFSTSLNAASFNCKKASTRIELLICNKLYYRLSEKDERLSKEYNKLLSVVDLASKESIRKIQRQWLLKRDQIDEGKYTVSSLEFEYDSQINRLEFFRRNIQSDLNIKNPKIQVIFELLVAESISEPDYIIKLDDDRYLLTITNTGRIAQGIYAANTKGRVISRILGGGWPEIIRSPTEDVPAFIIKSGTTHRGIMTISFGTIFLDNSILGVGSKWLYYLESDSESGFCGRGESIGLKTAQVLINSSIKNLKNSIVFELNVNEYDCKSGQISKIVKKYFFDKTGYREVL